MNDYNSLVEQARQKPDSTAAIAVQRMSEMEYQRRAERAEKVRSFFKRVFGKA